MAVSIIPERNGISRLDEMMSGVVGIDTNRVVRLLYPYNSLRVTDRRCCFTELSYRTDRPMLLCRVLSSADVQGNSRQVNAIGCLS